MTHGLLRNREWSDVRSNSWMTRGLLRNREWSVHSTSGRYLDRYETRSDTCSKCLWMTRVLLRYREWSEFTVFLDDTRCATEQRVVRTQYFWITHGPLRNRECSEFTVLLDDTRSVTEQGVVRIHSTPGLHTTHYGGTKSGPTSDSTPIWVKQRRSEPCVIRKPVGNNLLTTPHHNVRQILPRLFLRPARLVVTSSLDTGVPSPSSSVSALPLLSLQSFCPRYLLHHRSLRRRLQRTRDLVKGETRPPSGEPESERGRTEKWNCP